MYSNKIFPLIFLIYSLPSVAMLEGDLVRFSSSQPYGGAPYSKDVVEQAKIDIKKDLIKPGKNKYVLRFSISEKHQECNLDDVDRPFFAVFYVGAELKQVRPAKKVISELEFEVTGSSLHVGRKNCNGLEAKNQALNHAAQLWNLQMRKLYGQKVQAEIDSLVLNMRERPGHTVGSLMFKGLFHSVNGAEVVLEGMLDGGKAVIEVAGDIGNAIVENSDVILSATQTYNSTYSGNTSSDPAMEILNQSQRNLTAMSKKAIAALNQHNQHQFDQNKQQLRDYRHQKRKPHYLNQPRNIEQQRVEAMEECKGNGGDFDVSKSTCTISRKYKNYAVNEITKNRVSDSAENTQQKNSSILASINVSTKNDSTESKGGNQFTNNENINYTLRKESMVLCWQANSKKPSWYCDGPIQLLLSSAESLDGARSLVAGKRCQNGMVSDGDIPPPGWLKANVKRAVFINCGYPLSKNSRDVIAIHNIGGAPGGAQRTWACDSNYSFLTTEVVSERCR